MGGGGGSREGGGGSGAFLRSAETTSQTLPLDLNSAAQAANPHLSSPFPVTVQIFQLHLRAAGSPSVNTLPRPGPDGTELTQK